MKKIMTFLVLFSLIFFVSCKEKEEETNNQEEEQTKEKAEYIHLFKDLKDEEFAIEAFKLENIPFVLMEKISRLPSYRKETKGETTASFLITYHQKIDDTYIKNEEENHLITISTSTLVDVYLEAYFKQENIEIRTKEDDDFSNMTYEEFKNKYGIFPYDYNIEGFQITKESLLSIEKLYNKDGLNAYKIVIDGEIGSRNLKHQMQEYGSLKSEPVFSYV